MRSLVVVAGALTELATSRMREALRGAPQTAQRSGRLRAVFIVASVLVGFGLVPSMAGAITFADGLVHIIDDANSFPFEDVEVRDGLGGIATTVELVAGGEVGTGTGTGRVYAFDSSVAIVSGGEIANDLWLQQNASASVSGGIIGQNVRGFDNSNLNISGGQIIEDVHFLSSGVLRISGGLIGRTVEVSPGAQAFFSGGQVNGIFNVSLSLAGLVDISGGSFSGDVQVVSLGGHPKPAMHGHLKTGHREA